MNQLANVVQAYRVFATVKNAVKRSFLNLVSNRTSQFIFSKYLIEYQNVKIDSEIKI